MSLLEDPVQSKLRELYIAESTRTHRQTCKAFTVIKPNVQE